MEENKTRDTKMGSCCMAIPISEKQLRGNCDAKYNSIWLVQSSSMTYQGEELVQILVRRRHNQIHTGSKCRQHLQPHPDSR